MAPGFHSLPIFRTVLALALVLGLAACGGSDETPASAARAATVSVEPVDGVGDVLVDVHGAALYTPAEEADGTIRCTGGCAAIWTPLQAGASAPTAGADLGGTLDVVERADGTRQVTYGGRPLYRFSQDPEPGRVTGDGVKDSFGGTSFTWHAVTTKGASAGSSGTSPGKAGGGYTY